MRGKKDLRTMEMGVNKIEKSRRHNRVGNVEKWGQLLGSTFKHEAIKSLYSFILQVWEYPPPPSPPSHSYIHTNHIQMTILLLNIW